MHNFLPAKESFSFALAATRNTKIMDQIEGQKLLDHAAKTDECHHFLRRTLQVVISVSLLSLFFFCYPGVFFFPYSLVHTLERKYMFIICNGILAFLAKSSSSQSLHSYSDETVLGGKFSGAVPKLAATDVVSEEQTLSPAGVSFVDEEGKEQETVEDQEADHEEQEEQDKSENLGSSAENESKNDSDEEDNGRFSIKEEEAEEVEEATESTAGEELTTSTDELNKKFEEFIRKMKEELRIQAQQQLIKV